MATHPTPPPRGEGTTWQFYLVIAVITIGVLMILVKTFGIV